MKNSITELAVESQQEIELMVKSVTSEISSNGSAYQRIAVQDKEGATATFLRFDDPIAMESPVVCRMLVETSRYNGRPSYKVMRSEIQPNASLADYSPKARIDPVEGFKEVNLFYKKIQDSGYRRIVSAALGKDTVKFRSKPLTAFGPYARQSGLMEATLALLRMAEPAVALYQLDADLTYSACILYFLGNIDLVSDGYMPTEDDLLAGEINAASRRVIEAELSLRAAGVTEKELPRRKVDLLVHVLTSRYTGMKSAVPESVALKSLANMVRNMDESCGMLKNAAPGTVVSRNGKQMLKI